MHQRTRLEISPWEMRGGKKETTASSARMRIHKSGGWRWGDEEKKKKIPSAYQRGTTRKES